MLLQQFYLKCLAHASYLVADERSKQAVVVDPQRDIEQYMLRTAMATKRAARASARRPRKTGAAKKTASRKVAKKKAAPKKAAPKKALRRVVARRPSEIFAPVKGAERREIGHVLLEVGKAGNARVKRLVYPAGFRWSKDMPLRRAALGTAAGSR